MAGNLPVHRSSFFGRVADLARLEKLRREGARAITLCGAGGVGKTRLALEVLRTWESEFDGGVWFCDAAAAHTAEDLCRVVADALGVELGPSGERQLRDVLSRRGPTLLCLDNLEQMVEVAAPIVARWLDVSANLRILATSRARLRIGAEHVVELPPLSDKGAALFIERAMQAGMHIEPEQSSLVDQIVAALEFHPLAIELAASRTSLLTLEELAAMLPARWDVLEFRRGDAPERHHSLSATLWWSWRLLEPAAQRLLARCALFAGAFDRHDVALMLGDEALQGLAQLREVSLLRADTRDKRLVFSMFVPIRDFARARLGELGLDEDARQDHAQWVVTKLARVTSLDAHGELVADAFAVHDWALRHASPEALSLAHKALEALGPYFRARGPVGEPLGRWDALVNVTDAPSLRSYVERGTLHRLAGNLDAARRDFALANALDGADDHFLVAFETSRTHYAAGNLSEAFRFARLARDRARTLREQGLAATLLGRVEHGAGETHRARTSHQTAIAKLHAPELERERCHALMALAFVEQDLGLSDEAERHYLETLDGLRRRGHRREEATVIGFLGNVHRGRGERAAAERRYHDALAVFREQGAVWHEAVFLMDLGILLSMNADPSAADALAKALEAAAASDNARCEALTHGHLGVVEADCGRIEAAEAHFRRAADILGDPRDGQFPAVLEIQRHHVALARQRAGEPGTSDAAVEARGRLGAPSTLNSDHLRIARQLLTRAVDRTAPPDGALQVAADGAWFKGEASVDLTAHRSWGRLVLALAEARDVLTVDALFAAGWPGETAVGGARKNRVRVAISGLRKRGLAVTFDRGEGGYRLVQPVVVLPVPKENATGA